MLAVINVTRAIRGRKGPVKLGVAKGFIGVTNKYRDFLRT